MVEITVALCLVLKHMAADCINASRFMYISQANKMPTAKTGSEEKKNNP